MNPISTYRPFGQPAAASVTVLRVPAAGKTVTVNGTVFTMGTDFHGRNVWELAQALAASVNADRGELNLQPMVGSPVKSFYAFALGTVVWLIATVPGTGGNSFALTTNDSASFTVSGANFSGGTDSTGPGSVGTSFGTGADIIVLAAGTAVQGTSLSTPRGALICAPADNVGAIYVGSSNVTKGSGSIRGLILTQLGMSSQSLPVANMNQIWVNADNNNDRACVLAL